nr:DEAD/DEAH box helicase family protein [uncultured Nitrososphaera sp.]
MSEEGRRSDEVVFSQKTHEKSKHFKEMVDDLDRTIEDASTKAASIIVQLKEARERAEHQLEGIMHQMEALGAPTTVETIDREKFTDFVKHPYAVVEKGDDQFYVVTPAWVPFGVGWLEKQIKGWNYFVINRYSHWIGDLPKELQDKFKFEREPLPVFVRDGFLHTRDSELVDQFYGKSTETQQKAWDRYRQHLVNRDGPDKIKIKQGHEFQLIDELVKDGIMPVGKRHVDPQDMMRGSWTGIQLHDGYQKRAYTEFLEYGSIGVYWPPGAGKTMLGLTLLELIRPPNVIIVPGPALRDQWIERLHQYHFPPDVLRGIDIVTFKAYEKIRDKHYNLKIVDESHRLPANSYAVMSTVDAKYTLGLTATPYREDGRADLIIALTGKPVGMNWQEIISHGVVKQPKIRVYIVDSYRTKMQRLEHLLKDDKRTLIYSYWLEPGRQIAEKFKLPFLHGGTKNNYETMKNSPVFVVSSVGSEGIDLPDLERIVEFSFQFGSRREEAQLAGRIMHSKVEGQVEHVILFTEEEAERYEKRLYSHYSHGFKIEMVR